MANCAICMWSRRRTSILGPVFICLEFVAGHHNDIFCICLSSQRGKKNVECFILFPEGRVSEIQQLQMTSVLDPNVHCVAVQGTFDDCQDIVKALFRDCKQSCFEIRCSEPPCECLCVTMRTTSFFVLIAYQAHVNFFEYFSVFVAYMLYRFMISIGTFKECVCVCGQQVVRLNRQPSQLG